MTIKYKKISTSEIAANKANFSAFASEVTRLADAAATAAGYVRDCSDESNISISKYLIYKSGTDFAKVRISDHVQPSGRVMNDFIIGDVLPSSIVIYKFAGWNSDGMIAKRIG